MAQKKQNPGDQAGAPRNLSCQISSHSISTAKAPIDQFRIASDVMPKTTHARAHPTFRSAREAALMLLGSRPDLPRREAGFLGHMCVTDYPTYKQWRWLSRLLRDNGLPAILAVIDQ